MAETSQCGDRLNVSQKFMLAGNAIFTATGPTKHFTYRVRPARTDPGRLRVEVLTGPDNGHSYTYLCDMTPLGVITPPSFATCNARTAADYFWRKQSARVFRWVVQVVWGGREVPEGYSIRHCERCGRCGRRLTDPLSIETGLGPECRRRED